MNETNFTILLITTEVIFSLIVLFFLKKAGAKNSTVIISFAIMGLWLYSVYNLITSEFFSSTAIPQLTFTIGVFLPVAIILVLKTLSQDLKKTISNMSTSDFLNLQQYRVAFGVLFFFTGVLPTWFQYLGGLGDIAAGIGAITILRMFKNKKIDEFNAIIKGNIIGILDFVVVLNIGAIVVLAKESPDVVFNMIPLYVVPIFIAIHIFSLSRLKSLKK